MLGRSKPVPAMPAPSPLADWPTLLPGVALWALALYLPLSGPLARLEDALAEGDLEEDTQIKLLVVSSLLLALGVGVLADLVISWSLGPSWATSLGFMAALGGFVLSLAGRRDS